MKSNYYLFCFLFFVSCDTRQVEYKYFPNDKIQLRIEKRNGKYDGELVEYYANGNLKLIQHWKDGLHDGSEEEYYSNGKIFLKAHLKDNKFIDLMRFYENGKIKSRNFYNKEGEIVDVIQFKMNGERDSVAYPFSYTIPVGDTLPLGKESLLRVRIVNVTDSIYKNGQLIITNSIDTLTNYGGKIKDTLALIRPIDDYTYIYKLTPTKKGKQIIMGQFHFQKKIKNEMFFEESFFYYPIYVKE